MKTSILVIGLLSASLAAFAQSEYPHQMNDAPELPLHQERGNRWMPAMVLTLDGQVNAPNNIPTNIPQASSITNSTFDLSIGVVGTGVGAQSGTVENIIEGRWHPNNTIFIGAEIQNGAASSVVDKIGLGFGLSKRWDTAEIYGLVGVRRDFSSTDPSGATRASWEFKAGGGLAYRPFSNGALQPLATYLETIAVYRIGDQRAALETDGGLRWFF